MMWRGLNGILEGCLGLAVEGGEGRTLGNIRKQGTKVEGRGLKAFQLSPCELANLGIC